MQRQVRTSVRGQRTQDGAGVSLVRVLGQETAKEFDPFLMLDCFDSTDPADYLAGFPLHPHRGIETVTYLAQGAMVHTDNLGNRAEIGSGEAQWLTAGSGAFHSEMPRAAERMLGVQVWLNLPQKDKMADPAYRGIRAEDIPEVEEAGGTVRVIAGSLGDAHGCQGAYLPLDFYDVRLVAGGAIEVPADADATCVVFTLEGPVQVGEAAVAAKTAALLGPGDCVRLSAGDQGAEALVMCAPALHEPLALYGPLAMNTMDEIITALDEIDAGTFVKVEQRYAD